MLCQLWLIKNAVNWQENSGSSEEPVTLSAHIMMTKNVESDSGGCELSHLQVLSCQNDAAITIQRHFRGWRACKIYNKRKMNIIVIQVYMVFYAL